jgi:UDP-N-acetylmuramate: L-alanyl-gamma-D-glutamyl-meso-diaminopimelate ligase
VVILKEFLMNVHFIAIGGSAMHNLAIALHRKGDQVTGSDDEIFEPSRTRLEKEGILPDSLGWDVSKITNNLDAVILGMHAHEDNPELLRAKELGVKIFSYPEYLYEQSKNKKRVVIGGSHGKTTITSMILHVLGKLDMDADYMVGAQLQGFDVMVKLTESAPVMIIEGDEYLTSPIDRRPKFHLYMPDVALISGIAWDHFNVFPTFDNYIDQFRIFASLVPENGRLIYCNEDAEVRKVSETATCKNKYPYSLPDYRIDNEQTIILHQGKEHPIQVFGKHNLLNLNGARLVCNSIGVSDDDFYTSIMTFTGASKRLECIAKSPTSAVYKDFAHSPSKLQATIQAVKEQFPNRTLVACMELHTYSSLNAGFLSQYRDSMNMADVAAVFYSKHALELKRLPMLSNDDIYDNFNRKDIRVFNNTEAFQSWLKSIDFNNTNLLLMSSGNFDGIALDLFAKELI